MSLLRCTYMNSHFVSFSSSLERHLLKVELSIDALILASPFAPYMWYYSISGLDCIHLCVYPTVTPRRGCVHMRMHVGLGVGA